MILSAPLIAVPCLSLCMAGAGWWLLRLSEQQDLRGRRITAVRYGANEAGPDTRDDASGLPLRLVASIGVLLSRSGLLPANAVMELERTLAATGLRQRNALPLFIGAKLLLFVLLPSLAFLLLPAAPLSPPLRMLLIAGAAVGGLLLPDLIIQRRRSAYLAQVNRGLPDALDMLVICGEAGLGLELSLERVAAEIAPSHAAIAAELRLTCSELRILADRRLALANMGTRTGLDTLKRLGGTLIQTLQYGTPLSQALRTLASEMRYEMLMRFEAQATRLPVLLTVPMILFILPCIFIVVGGPAALTVARTFMHH